MLHAAGALDSGKQARGLPDTGDMHNGIRAAHKTLKVGVRIDAAAELLNIQPRSVELGGIGAFAHKAAKSAGIIIIYKLLEEELAGMAGDAGDSDHCLCSFFISPVPPSTTPLWRRTLPMVMKKILTSKAKLRFRAYSPS